MISISKRKFLYLLLFIVFAIGIELINFKLLNFGLLPKFFMMDIAFILYLCAILILIPFPEVQFWTQTLLILLQIILSVVNVNLKSITGEIFFWDMLALAQDGAQALEGTSILDLSALWFFGGLFLIYQVIHFVIWKYRIKTLKKFNLHQWVYSLVLTLILFITGFVFNNAIYKDLTIQVQDASEEEIMLSEAYLYETMFQPETTIKTFGTYPFYMKGLSYYIGIDTSSEASLDIIDEYLSEGVFETNDYTNISEGNNVIMILLESFEYFGIDETLTPNLYQLFYEDGILLNNFHSKVKTDVAEASSLFGSYPSTGSLYRNFRQKDYPTSLPNLLKENTTISLLKSYHNNEGSFYNRNNAHPHFGFDEHIDSSDMVLSDTGFWINSDEDMLKDQVENMIPENEQFLTFITTFTMHGGYEKREVFNDTYDYFDLIGYHTEDTSLDQYIRTYMAAAMDLDRAIGILFDRLELLNLLDCTTIILYADHTAYYYGFSEMMRGIYPSEEYYIDQYRLPAVIYDTKLKNAMSINGLDSIDKFSTVNDFTPTILNLLGIEFNPLWYVGNDLFSNHESVIISRLSGIFNDLYYTTDGKTILYESPQASSGDYQNFQEAVAYTMKKQQHLNLIYRINYFKSED